MKTLKYILWAFLAAFAAVGCSDDPTYTAGSEEDPDNYGVYFPTQTSPTEVELDPAEEPEITYKVRRTRYLDAITVPVEITTSAEEIFEIEPIVFGPGEEETEFTVSFPNAKEGETYTCDIRIVDPHYISIYGPRATSLSFSVLRAGWELVTEGEATKGKWRDEVIGDIYSMDVSTFNPYPEVEVEIYQRTDLPGYYRVKVYNSALVTALVGQQMNVQSRDVWTIIDARDPNRVFLPYQSTGLTLNSSDGELKFASNVAENFVMEESAGQYGTLKDGVITFPAQSILLELEKEAGSFFYGNRNGMHRILMPGVVIPDYTVTLAKSEPKEGVVEIAATFAADAREMKYAVFEGVLDDGQASLTAQDMDKNKDNPDTFQGSITESGTIRVENRQTGKYTLVGCIYDEEGTMRSYAFVSFGYVAADDEKPVILTVGLEATNEYAGQGLTSDNSAKFYAYGEGIESAVYGLFRSSRLEGIDKNALLDSQGTPFTEEQLAQLNDKHFSVMLTGLNGDSEYTLLMRASNGYISEIKEAAYKTTGTYNPAMEDFVYEDFLSAEEQPSVEKLRSTAWNYYAMDLMDYSSEQPMRRKIGSVTMTDNPEITAQAGGTVLNVDGLSGIDFESGGSVFGFYIPGNQTFDGYNGVLALYTDKDLTPATYKGKSTILGFTPLESPTSIYYGYGLFVGAVADGYLYCVPSPAGVQQGLTFNYFFTGTTSEVFSMMTEMMLVDPEKDLGGELPSAALQRIAELRRQAVKAFAPRNCVELPEFSGGAGCTGPAKPVLPGNLAVNPMPASAPSVKRADAATTAAGPAAGGASAPGDFRKTGVRAEKRLK